MEQSVLPPQIVMNIDKLFKLFSHFIIWAENIYGLFSPSLCAEVIVTCVNVAQDVEWHFDTSRTFPGALHAGGLRVLVLLEVLVSPWSALCCHVKGQHICLYLSEAPPCAQPSGSHVVLCFCKHGSSFIMRSLIYLSSGSFRGKGLYPIHLCLPGAPLRVGGINKWARRTE